MLILHRALRVAAVIAAAVLVSIPFATVASAQNCGPMDVTFIIDNSGSMTDVIAQVQQQVVKIADAVQTASGGDYQFGLVNMPANDVNVLLDMTANNRALLDAAVKQMTTTSSFGPGIAFDEALDTVLNHLGPRQGSTGKQTGTFQGQWRANAAKIIMVITDTGPQGFDTSMGTHDQKAHAMAVLAATLNIRITSIFVPTGGGADPAIDRPILQDLATTSGGLFKETQPDASDLADVIIDIVKACGGSSGAGSNLLIDPQEIVLTNGESGDVHITNFAPGPNHTTVYSAEPAEEGAFTIVFNPVASPADSGTEEEVATITVGPDTFQGTHFIAVRANTGTADDFAIIHVIVDCQPPYFLSSGQPQSQTVGAGTAATLKVTPGGDGPLHYQWYHGYTGITSSPIAGAISAQYTTDTTNASGDYWVRVWNACGSRDSAVAVVNQP